MMMMVWKSITNGLNISVSCVGVFWVIPFFICRMLKKVLLWSCIRSSTWLGRKSFESRSVGSMNMNSSVIHII